jgi:hypothetical protein
MQALQLTCLKGGGRLLQTRFSGLARWLRLLEMACYAKLRMSEADHINFAVIIHSRPFDAQWTHYPLVGLLVNQCDLRSLGQHLHGKV